MAWHQPWLGVTSTQGDRGPRFEAMKPAGQSWLDCKGERCPVCRLHFWSFGAFEIVSASTDSVLHKKLKYCACLVCYVPVYRSGHIRFSGVMDLKAPINNRYRLYMNRKVLLIAVCSLRGTSCVTKKRLKLEWPTFDTCNGASYNIFRPSYWLEVFWPHQSQTWGPIKSLPSPSLSHSLPGSWLEYLYGGLAFTSRRSPNQIELSSPISSAFITCAQFIQYNSSSQEQNSGFFLQQRRAATSTPLDQGAP